MVSDVDEIPRANLLNLMIYPVLSQATPVAGCIKTLYRHYLNTKHPDLGWIGTEYKRAETIQREIETFCILTPIDISLSTLEIAVSESRPWMKGRKY